MECREFNEQEKETLTRIREASQDSTEVDTLVLVQTERDGKPCVTLCILTRDAVADLARLQPVALLLTPEEADKLINPFTGSRGLPWIKNPNQLELKGLEDGDERGTADPVG